MKIYPYTSFDKIGSILGKRPSEPSGLVLGRSLGGLRPTFGLPRAIFGLREPVPDSWQRNPHFTDTWRSLVHDLWVGCNGALLLEAEVDGVSGDVLVGERAYMEGRLYPTEYDIPAEFVYPAQADAEAAYVESLVPLGEYVNREKIGRGFSLPEVVVLAPIAAGNVAVSHEQPLLEQELRTTFPDQRKVLSRLILDGWAHRELEPWKSDFEHRFGNLTSV